jgi:hypothetical protein
MGLWKVLRTRNKLQSPRARLKKKKRVRGEDENTLMGTATTKLQLPPFGEGRKSG